jgi:hypothetical protein
MLGVQFTISTHPTQRKLTKPSLTKQAPLVGVSTLLSGTSTGVLLLGMCGATSLPYKGTTTRLGTGMKRS